MGARAASAPRSRFRTGRGWPICRRVRRAEELTGQNPTNRGSVYGPDLLDCEFCYFYCRCRGRDRFRDSMTESAGREHRGAPAGVVHSALAVGGFAIGTTEFATMSLLPFFAKDLGIDAPTAGHVISAYALGGVVGAPLIAVLSARMARRTLLILLMTVFAVANGLSALAPTYHWMLLFRFLSGMPHGAYFGIAALVAASLVPLERRTQAVARVLLGLTIATIIGVPFANWVGQAFGWRWGFAIVAFLAALTVVLVATFAPR